MGNIRMSNPDPRDINYLRKLIASGQLSDQDLSAGTLSGTESAPIPPADPPSNALADMRANPDSYQLGGKLPTSNDENLMKAVPGAGFQGLKSGQGVVQATNPDGTAGPVIRLDFSKQVEESKKPKRGQVFGVGGGVVDDLGDADIPREGIIDYSRNGINIPGLGSGKYGKDGNAYGTFSDGTPWKAVLGYDREATQAAQDRRMKLAQFDLAQKHGQAQIEKLQADTDLTNSKPTEKAPSGFQFKADGQGLEPIPGGPADFKQQGVFNADTATLQSSMADLDRLATSANTILKNEKGLEGITGIQGAFPNIPGSAAANAQADLGSLKAQVGFGVLQAMRNASKTGGALGNVSDAEGKRLEAALGSLEKAQDLKQFKERLQGIVDFSTQAKERLFNAYNMKYNPVTQAGGLGARQANPDVSRQTNGNLSGMSLGSNAILDEARNAIAKGASKELVNKRLQEKGLGPL